MEINLYEVVPPEQNARGDMGRVVVPPPPKGGQSLEPTQRSKIFLCCDRIFLTHERLITHRNSDCVKKYDRKGPSSVGSIIKQVCQRFKTKPMEEMIPKEEEKDTSSSTFYTCSIIDVGPYVDRRDDDGIPNFYCKLCSSYIISNVQKMCRHLRGMHSIEVPNEVVKITEENIISKGYSKQRMLNCFFECDACDTFASVCLTSMVLHKQKAHEVDGRFPCPHCTCRYGTDNGLRIHIHRIHSEMTSFLDLPLIKDLPTTSLHNTSAFEEGATKQVRTDDWVQKSYDLLKTLPFHDTDDTFENVKPFRCNFCSKDFKKQSQLASHKLKCHYTDTSSGSAKKVDMDSENKRPGSRVMKDGVVLSPMTGPSPGSRKRKMNSKGVESKKASKKSKLEETRTEAHVEVTCSPILITEMETDSVVNESSTGKSLFENLECTMCGYHASDKPDFEFHLKVAHVVLGVECICGCSFATASELTKHKSMSCSKNPMKFEVESTPIVQTDAEVIPTNHKEEPSTPQSIVKTHDCECGETFGNRKDFRNHKTEGHCKIRILEDQLFLKDIIQRKSEKKIDAELKLNTESATCDICEKIFVNELGLQRHNTAMHKDEKDYSTCELCGYNTANRKMYKEHYHRCHTGTFKCPVCVCTFKDIDGVARHMTGLHKRTLEKTQYLLKCDHDGCEFTAYYERAIINHKKLAHSIKPMEGDQNLKNTAAECDICKTKTHSLDDHIQRCHVENGVPCPEKCGCTFKSEKSMSMHMRRKHGKAIIIPTKELENASKKIECANCDFKGKDMRSLQMHCSKMHGFSFKLPKRTRHCDICHVKIKECLSAHKKRVHVPNGFKCQVSDCTYSFETYTSRAHHMKKAHQMKTIKQCKLCLSKYSSTTRQHLQKCHVPGGLKCDICPCTFENESGKAVHMRMRHQLKGVNYLSQCEICGIKPKNGVAYHMKRCHFPNGFSCNFCSYTFEKELGRARHMVIRHNIKVETTCELCGIKPKFGLSYHMNHSHYDGPEGFSCKFCPCKFKTERVRLLHLAKQHNYVVQPGPSFPAACPVCNKRMRNLPVHMERHHVKDGFQCDKCCWSMKTETGLAIHKCKAHGDKWMFKLCPHCDKRMPNLSDHLKRHHVQDGFQCDKCSWSLSTESGLVLHKQRAHGDEREFKRCPQCDKRMPNLAEHIRRHHVKDGFQCDKCCWSIKTENGLAIHKVKAHGDKWDFKQCPHCEKRMPNLLDHIKRHHVKDGHKCVKCNWSFSTEAGLAFHMRKVHGEKMEYKRPFLNYRKTCFSTKIRPPVKMAQCELCGSKMQHSILNKHYEFNHSSMHNFKCHFCTCRFAKSIGRYHHIQKMHKKEPGAQEFLKKSPKKNGQESPKIKRSAPSTPKNMNLKIVSVTSCSEVDNNLELSSPVSNPVEVPVDKIIKTETILSPKAEVQCKSCGYLATCKYNLNIHLQNSHVKDSTFACSNCSCAFANEMELNRHEKIAHRRSSNEEIITGM